MMSARTRAREIWSYARFDGPGQAARRSAALAISLGVSMTGIARSYRAASAREVIPPDLYAEFSGVGADWVMTGYLLASDAVGRLWLPVSSWVPEPVAWAVLGAVLGGYYVLAIDIGWRAAKQAHSTGDSEVPA